MVINKNRSLIHVVTIVCCVDRKTFLVFCLFLRKNLTGKKGDRSEKPTKASVVGDLA